METTDGEEEKGERKIAGKTALISESSTPQDGSLCCTSYTRARNGI
jgi:hypothetical protein